MIGEMIKEYLVGLGVQIDKPGFAEMDSTIKTTSNVIERATGSWATNFIKASGIIVTAIASVSSAVVGLMKTTASQDLEMEKFARRMMVTKDTAWEMKKATDALGESVADIVITPELMDRYKALVNDGRQMKIGGDFEATMKGFRDLMFEFTRLKQEVSYAMSWVGYYLMKYLNRPLQEAKENFRSFNDSFIKNMSTWTEKAARYLVYIINIGIHLWDFIKAITKFVYSLWNSFPKGVKIATAALTAFFMVLKASPFSRMIMLVGTLLLLIDDYFGYMEGKQAQFGKYWDLLNKYIAIAKELFKDFSSEAKPIWEKFIYYVTLAKDKAFEFGKYLLDLANRIKNSKEFQEFIKAIKRLFLAFWNLAGSVIKTVINLITSLYEAMADNGSGKEFKKLLSNLWEIFLALLNAIAYCFETLHDWLEEASRSDIVRDFFNAIVELFNAFMELYNAIYDLVKTVLVAFLGGMQNTKPIYSFKDAVKAVVNIITAMIRVVSIIIRYLAKFFKMMVDNREFKEFWEGLGKAVKNFGGIISDVMTSGLKRVGKLGQALLALVKGDFKRAAQLAGLAIFGGDDKDNPKGSSGGIGEASADATSERAQYVYKKLIDEGFTPEQAAGIVGNLVWESNLDTTIRSSDGYNSVGIAQWTGDREDALYAFARERGEDLYSLDTQIAFLIYELNHKEKEAKETLLSNSDTPEEAAQTFGWGPNGNNVGAFERPDKEYAHMPERKANARAIYDYMQNNPYDTSDSSVQNAKWQIPNDWLNILNKELLEKFNDFLHELESNGYGFDFQGAGENWTGIKIIGDTNLESIQGLASKYGLGASGDEHGYYFSLNGEKSINDVDQKDSDNKSFWGTVKDKAKGWLSDVLPVSTNGLTANMDPIMYNNMMRGGYQAVYGGTGNTYYNINVGGVNVNNTNASPQEIGQAVGQETCTALEEKAKYTQRSKSINPVWI